MCSVSGFAGGLLGLSPGSGSGFLCGWWLCLGGFGMIVLI